MASTSHCSRPSDSCTCDAIAWRRPPATLRTTAVRSSPSRWHSRAPSVASGLRASSWPASDDSWRSRRWRVLSTACARARELRIDASARLGHAGVESHAGQPIAARLQRGARAGLRVPHRRRAGVRRSGRGAAAASSVAAADAARRGGGRGRAARVAALQRASAAPWRADRAVRCAADRDRAGGRGIAQRPDAARRAAGRVRWRSRRLRSSSAICRRAPAIRSRNSLAWRTTISAACDGVAARTSATKSAMVVSVSWPIAAITGTGHAAIARATTSSLKAQRSSSDPPPRPTITTSTPGDAGDARDGAGDLGRRALALHARRADDDVGWRAPRAQHAQHVAHGRALERGHDADAARQHRQGTLARGIEQALGLQAPVAAARRPTAARRRPSARCCRRTAGTCRAARRPTARPFTSTCRPVVSLKRRRRASVRHSTADRRAPCP